MVVSELVVGREGVREVAVPVNHRDDGRDEDGSSACGRGVGC